MEKAILVGLELKNDTLKAKDSLDELAQLIRTAGAEILASLIQKREKPDGRYFIGLGKAEELKALCLQTGANLVVIDHDISPSQARNLEELIAVKVIDRTELILDIFAQHAHTQEGKLQVELAQANFLMSRLTGQGTAMSRLGGGIGTRGPGETKLEMDRQRIRKRISLLKKEVEKIHKHRVIQRKRRKSAQMSSVAIVGYTNAGKSSLLDALSNTHIRSEDKLFATLDPTIKRVYLPDGRTVLITDTVGFIQKLPHTLVSAFKATLEEISEADLLLHVADASSNYLEEQISTVYKVLEELNVITKPIITVFNKIDKLSDRTKIIDQAHKYDPAVMVSALKKTGLEDLLKRVCQQLSPPA